MGFRFAGGIVDEFMLGKDMSIRHFSPGGSHTGHTPRQVGVGEKKQTCLLAVKSVFCSFPGQGVGMRKECLLLQIGKCKLQIAN